LNGMAALYCTAGDFSTLVKFAGCFA